MRKWLFLAACAAAVAPLAAQQLTPSRATDGFRGGLRARRAAHAVQRHPARVPLRRSTHVAAGRPLLVSHDDTGRIGGGPRRSLTRLEGQLRPAGVRPDRRTWTRCRRRTRRSGANGCAVARREADRLHQGLEPLGARSRHRQGNAADDGRRRGLRLRDRQRRLDESDRADPARGRPTRRRSPPFSRTSARSATCISSTRRSAIRSSKPGSIRCPATRSSP